jgi:hypothetical protein
LEQVFAPCSFGSFFDFPQSNNWEGLMTIRLWFANARQLALGLGLAAALAGSANAQKVLIDFGTNLSFRGASTVNPDSNGNTWNNYIPGAFVTDLKDIANVATTIDFGPELGFGVGTDSYNGPAGDTSTPPTSANVPNTDIDAAALGNLGVLTAAFDYAASPGPDATGQTVANLTRFQIQGLDPLKSYSLDLFGSHKFNLDNTTVYSVFNDPAYSSLVGTANLQVHTPGMPWLHNRDTVAKIGGLTPDANGILYLQFVGATGAQGFLNSMQITGVPEPSSILLLVGSSLGLAFGVRRRM